MYFVFVSFFISFYLDRGGGFFLGCLGLLVVLHHAIHRRSNDRYSDPNGIQQVHLVAEDDDRQEDRDDVLNIPHDRDRESRCHLCEEEVAHIQKERHEVKAQSNFFQIAL